MKTKNEIYVVVDTTKKVKKLQKVLDMFCIIYHKDQFEFVIFYFDVDSRLYSTESTWHIPGKQKVSIKELRNILAVEHLKEGDFVVCGIGHIEYVTKYKRFDGNYFESIDYYMIGGSGKTHGCGCFDNFIRYATEEERLLLYPKEEKLTKEDYKDNTWYKRDNGGLFFLDKSKKNHYGFLCGSEWYEEIYWFKNYKLNGFDKVGTWQEATTEEVKQALIKEAEHRGLVEGAVCNNSNIHGFNVGNNLIDYFGGYEFNVEKNELRVLDKNEVDTWYTIFKNGKWAEVLPHSDTHTEITDQDIATLERLHDTLHDVHGYSLEFELMKSARVLADKLMELNTQTK